MSSLPKANIDLRVIAIMAIAIVAIIAVGAGAYLLGSRSAGNSSSSGANLPNRDVAAGYLELGGGYGSGYCDYYPTGKNVTVSINVANKGNLYENNVVVSAFARSTSTHQPIKVGETMINLGIAENRTVIILWNFTQFRGNSQTAYETSADVSFTDGEVDSNPANNASIGPDCTFY